MTIKYQTVSQQSTELGIQLSCVTFCSCLTESGEEDEASNHERRMEVKLDRKLAELRMVRVSPGESSSVHDDPEDDECQGGDEEDARQEHGKHETHSRPHRTLLLRPENNNTHY